ncbi:hypothetical protein HUU05_26260, partial [candidate division KSB1 bacterium]|nr:hypothetical protein [candidate division KSB1 bacterium]
MKSIRTKISSAVFACVVGLASASTNDSYIITTKAKSAFTLSASGKSAPLYASSQDYPGVHRVLKQLQVDITRVTNAPPDL